MIAPRPFHFAHAARFAIKTEPIENEQVMLNPQFHFGSTPPPAKRVSSPTRSVCKRGLKSSLAYAWG
jgi:hypothetical protein